MRRQIPAAVLATAALIIAALPSQAGVPSVNAAGLTKAVGTVPGPIWSSEFEDGTLAAWRVVHAAAAKRVAVVSSPVRAGRRSVRLTANDADRGPTANPRAQLDGPVLHREGDDQYIAWSTFFPATFPRVGGPDYGGPPPWFVFFEWHGAPFNGSPAPGVFDVKTDAGGASTIGFSRSVQYGYDRPWTAPLRKGIWNDFVVRVKFSKAEHLGFVELWLNGQQQTFSNGTQRLRQSTIMADQNDGLFPIATNYRAEGMVPGDVTVYHDRIRVGRTYASVTR